MRRRLRQDHEAGDRGAAIVEFAIVLPILILLLTGIFEFGRAYSVQIQLTGAARDGARVMAITNDWSQAEAATLASAPGVDPAPTVARTPASCSPGANITVTATQIRSYSIPFFGQGEFTLVGEGVMRCGG